MTLNLIDSVVTQIKDIIDSSSYFHWQQINISQAEISLIQLNFSSRCAIDLFGTIDISMWLQSTRRLNVFKTFFLSSRQRRNRQCLKQAESPLVTAWISPILVTMAIFRVKTRKIPLVGLGTAGPGTQKILLSTYYLKPDKHQIVQCFHKNLTWNLELYTPLMRWFSYKRSFHICVSHQLCNRYHCYVISSLIDLLGKHVRHVLSEFSDNCGLY